MMRLTNGWRWFCAAAMAAMLVSWVDSGARAQSSPPPPAGSRGENFSNKPAPQLFNADCTGAGCHKSPQGLAKGQSQMGLAAFLREHYTNSRESAAALAAYIMKVPAGPAQPEPRAAARAGTGRPPADVPGASWFDPAEPGDPRQLRQPPQQGGKPARAAARSGEPKPTEAKPAEAKPADAKPADAKPTEAKPVEPKPAESKPEAKPESKPEPRPAEEPAAAAAEPKPAPAAESKPAHAVEPRPAPEPKPAPAAQHRNLRGRQPAVAATPAPMGEPAASPPPVARAAPQPPTRAAPPPQYDIFD